MNFFRWTLCAVALVATGCSFPTQDFRIGADAARDVALPDVALDLAPDAAPPPDVAPDTAPPPDVAPDTAPPPDTSGGCGAGPACAMGQTCCEGTCVDTQTSTPHCGRCGNVCDPANATGRCAAGACAVAMCDTGSADCDMNATNGCEVQTASDVAHCGRCANRCPTLPNAASSCSSGRCESSCDRGFGNCDMNAANGCEADLRASTSSCGACGRTCPAGINATATCNVGDCEVRCATGFGDCDESASNGCEVAIGTDPRNCGTCGQLCSFPNATATCASGSCRIGACSTGFGDCDMNPTNGCETPTTADSANCGSCGNRCPAGSFCSSGRCQSSCTTAPLMTCSGSCVDTSSSIAHCGGCNRACAPANATGECRGSSCVVMACAAGFADCDGNAANGCEAAINTDVSNCGGCRVSCNRTNGTPTCVAGACRIACTPGFADCDSDPSDGCETPTGTDPRNCGRCGNTCAAPNATATCVSGACGVGACTAGFGNCDGMVANGCEASTASDEANCGACARVCPTGQFCVSSVCSTVCRPPLTSCGTTCVDLTANDLNCGACGRACIRGSVCAASRCVIPPPSNDLCTGATDINLSAGSRITLSASVAGATHNMDSPCDSVGGADVFFRFVLTRRELVYADTFGTGWDTKLFLATSCTAPIRTALVSGDLTCDDNLGTSCTTGGTASQIYTVLPAGTYYLVLSSNGSVSTATLRFEHLNIGAGTVSFLGRGSSIRSGITSGTSGYSSSCGGTGPEQAFWWPTCPEQLAGTLTASTCSRATWNTVLSVVSGGGSGDLCNNDGTTCAPQSVLSTTIAAGAGIHALVVDGFSLALGSYSVQVTRP